MVTNQTEVDAVTERIRLYLSDHPNAADTVEGVAIWWLSGNASRDWINTVQRAIDQLAESGEITTKTLPDGAVIVERSIRSGRGIGKSL